MTALALLPLLSALTALLCAQNRPGSVPENELFSTIASLDRAVFDAYNTCDLEKFGAFFVEDLEFYHDQTGLTRSRQSFIEAVKNNICGKVRRELVSGTLEVYPMRGYGAVEIGVHRFHHPGREKTEPVGEAKFVHLWQYAEGAWKITRVISYDHHALALAAGFADAQTYSAQEAGRLRREVTLENWDDGGERSRFAYLNISQVFPVAVVRRAGPIVTLPSDPNPAIGRYVVEKEGGRDVTLDQLLSDGPFDAFLVVHRGRVVYERYPRMRPDDKHLLFSVTKALIGTAVAILEDRGELSVERPIGALIAELKGTAWEKVSVRDVLEMASGIEGGESAGDPYSDTRHKHYQLEASLGWLPKTPEMAEAVHKEDTYAYLSTLGRVREPGSRWEYASVNTAVLGWLLERVTGKRLADVLSDEIWSRMGAEGDALLVTNRNGVAVAHAGMAATLRDLARFGLLLAQREGTGQHVISDRVRRRITEGGRPQILEPGHPAWLSHVAYQWDGVTTKGDFFKGGFGDQLLYVAPRKEVVIAFFGTNQSLSYEPRLLPLGRMVDDLF